MRQHFKFFLLLCFLNPVFSKAQEPGSLCPRIFFIPSPPAHKSIRWKGVKHEWPPFEEARLLMRFFGIKNREEFYKWIKEGKIPASIPTNPALVYKEEWEGLYHFLRSPLWYDLFGLKLYKSRWLPFDYALHYIWQLGFRTYKEFIIWSKSDERPEGIPIDPRKVYSEYWKGRKHWIGRQKLSYEESQALVQSLGLKSRRDYLKLTQTKKYRDLLYANPFKSYKEWTNWYDYLGTSRYMKFHRAKAYARRLGLNLLQFRDWLKSDARPYNFPEKPYEFYEEWEGAVPFLGIRWMPLINAKKFIQSEAWDVTSKEEFRLWIKENKNILPKNFPINPKQVYGDRWPGWDIFLGLKSFRTKNWRPFEEARLLMISLGIKNRKGFLQARKDGVIPQDIPSNPHRSYAEYWKGLAHFLGLEEQELKAKQGEDSPAYSSDFEEDLEKEFRKRPVDEELFDILSQD